MRYRLLARRIGFAVVALVLVFLAIPVPRAALATRAAPSVRLVDRRGHLLREVLSSAAGTSVWVGLDHISPDLVLATLAAEDRRFWSHPGVDPIGVVRALWGNLKARKVESGASTIAMQWIGNATGSHPTTVGGKAWQALQALRLMTVLSRREVLERYLNTIPYGHQSFGIEAAARYYFHCGAGDLSLAQSAYLAAIPAAPSLYDPVTAPERVQARQRLILAALRARSQIPQDRYDAAEAESVTPGPAAADWIAPHFCDWILTCLGPRTGTVVTTLDVELQQAVEGILHQRLASLQGRHATNGAVIVLDNASGDVLAWVGSADYAHFQVNGALALRQPGSTLKPFLYGLAFERGWTPATVLPDLPFRYGGAMANYVPENYDGTFHGPVPLRTALACSYNAPAVYVLNHIGAPVLLDKLHGAGFDSLSADAAHYGLGLTLGDGEVSLFELARAYRMLANGGRYRPATIFLGDSGGPPHQVFSDRVAALLTDILSDHVARIPAFGRDSVLNLPFPCAAKTGTSQDFHDNWTVGYTTSVTVAVWVGNFDATPLRSVSGVTGAGGIFHDVMERLEASYPAAPFAKPAGLVQRDICPASGLLSGPDCPSHEREWFIEAYAPRTNCTVHRRDHGRLVTAYTDELLHWRQEAGLHLDPSIEHGTLGIESPSDGEVFRLDPVLRVSAQALHLSVIPPPATHMVQWYVDGTRWREVPAPFTARWPLQWGPHSIYACTATWRSSPVHIVVK